VSICDAYSIVPSFDVTVYLVLDDFGNIGRAYREADEARCDLDNIVACMLIGEYTKPVRVVAFNTAEGWSRDVSEEVAWEVLTRGEQAAGGHPQIRRVPWRGECRAQDGERALACKLGLEFRLKRNNRRL
jgi:hypothetical protein